MVEAGERHTQLIMEACHRVFREGEGLGMLTESKMNIT